MRAALMAMRARFVCMSSVAHACCVMRCPLSRCASNPHAPRHTPVIESVEDRRRHTPVIESIDERGVHTPVIESIDERGIIKIRTARSTSPVPFVLTGRSISHSISQSPYSQNRSIAAQCLSVSVSQCVSVSQSLSLSIRTIAHEVI